MRLAVAAGDGQSRFAATRLDDPIVARAVDNNGATVSRAGLPVTWSVRSGGGMIETASEATDGLGLASAAWVLGNNADPQVVEASSNGGGAAVFTATVVTEPGSIAYSQAFGGTDLAHVYVIDPDGGNRIRLITSNGGDRNPSWSPDGSAIAFTSPSPPGEKHLFVADRLGNDRRQLTTALGLYWDPSWSPDGTELVFTDQRLCADGIRGANQNLHIMSADGSSLRQLTFGDCEANRQPDWSPDGSRIAFVTGRHGGNAALPSGTGSDQIYLINPDGSGEVRVSQGQGLDIRPKWSPDGTTLLFTRDSTQLWTMQPDGTGQTMIYEAPDTGGSFPNQVSGEAWGPSGMRVLFSQGERGDRDLFVLDLQTGEVTQLTTVSGRRMYASWLR